MHDLRLGLFTFKNDDVLLLAGSHQALAHLAGLIECALVNGTTVLVHEISVVSNRHPAKLFAVNRPDRSLSENEFYWPCTASTPERLRALVGSTNEAYFQLSKPSLFLVTSGRTYGQEWWERYA